MQRLTPLTPLTPRDLKRGRSLAYMLLLTRAISRGRVTAHDAAAELGISCRTVYRMLRSLEAVGLRVESQREGHTVFWRLRRTELLRWFDSEPQTAVPETRHETK
ncbi:MAG: helix-turn-helix domain-containing protein [Myxococcota bacterium]